MLQVEANRDDSCLEVTALRRSSGMRTTPILNRSGANSDALVSGRAEAAVLTSGAQLSAQSWGTVMPFSAAVASSTATYSSGLTLNFQGTLAASGDMLGLSHYTVVRLP